MSKQSFRDLKNEIELKNAEIDELSMELESKNEEINKLKLYSTKLKYEKKNLEDKLDTKIDYDKARIKELDNLQEKIVEKESIIEDKQDQVKYLRSLIDDYKSQIKSNSEELEIQLRKISKQTSDALQVDLKFFGLENIPQDETFFLVSNHMSAFDPLPFLVAIPTPTTFVGKDELNKVPILKTAIKALDVKTIERDNLRQSLKVMLY